MYFGYHALIDCRNVPRTTCENDKNISKVLCETAEEVGLTVIGNNRYRFGFDSPPGCTVVVILDESHITAHSYSEKGKIAFDIFTVNSKATCEKAVNLITSKLNIFDFDYKIITRD